jgi:uncharacterized membrane protein
MITFAGFAPGSRRGCVFVQFIRDGKGGGKARAITICPAAARPSGPPAMSAVSGNPSPEFSLLASRPDSLGSAGRMAIFASLCGISFAFAGVFVALGAWLVLPYSALEMLLVYVAFRCMDRRAGDWERLAIQGETLTVTRSEAGRVTAVAFSRYWVRVTLDAACANGYGARLRLAESRRHASFGAFLPAGELRQVAEGLRAWLVRPTMPDGGPGQ